MRKSALVIAAVAAALFLSFVALAGIDKGYNVLRFPEKHVKEVAEPAALVEKLGNKRLILDDASEGDIRLFQNKGCALRHRMKKGASFDCPAGVAVNARESRVFRILDLDADRFIGADKVWAEGINGSGVDVVVLDTGIDSSHTELSDSLLGCVSFVSGEDCNDQNGHGTHVAGIITANGVFKNIDGTNDATGVSPGAGIYMLKVCGSSGFCLEDDMVAAMEYAVDNLNAKIMSISIGGGNFGSHCDSDPLAAKVNWVADNGYTVVIAAGNDGKGVSSPACASKAIAVGAVDKSGVVPWWSNRGSALDIIAPGVSILSTYSCLAAGDCTSYWYAYMSGTSMATPHVSGVAALLLQAKPAATTDEIKTALYSTADPATKCYKCSYFSRNGNCIFQSQVTCTADIVGAGIVDAYGAYLYIKPAPVVNDTEPPVVVLVNPPDAHTSTSSSVVFEYTPDDVLSGIAGCELLLNSAVDQTDTVIEEGVVNQFSKSLANGVYTWNVRCTDSSPNANVGSGTQRTLTVNADTEPPVIANATGDTSSTTGEAKHVSAVITDNIGVTSASVFYTPIGGTETSVAMASAGNVWGADVPVALNKVGTITYYIKAGDAAGNTARDPAGFYSIIVTDNDAPAANAGPDKTANVGQALTFDGSASSDNIGITSYNWDFGDSSAGTGAVVTHAYSAAGNYTATLTVSDAAGNAASDTLVVAVTVAPVVVTEFFDSFEVSEWNGLWVEDSQNDWFRSSQRARDGTRSAEVDGYANGATLTMANAVNLAGKGGATLTFSWFIESNWDKNEYICLDMFYSGAWHNGVPGTADCIDGSSNTGAEENKWIDVSADLAGKLTSDFKIRFRAKVSGSAEDGNVDKVTITSTA